MRSEPEREPLLDLDLAALVAWLEERGEPAFRVRQVLEWVFKHGAVAFESMTNLPGGLRENLAGTFSVRAAEEIRRSEAPDGTTKLLLRWPDDALSECVMIPDAASGRRTACLSTQVGCDVGCTFCASGLDGSLRNLGVGEILEQALAINDLLSDRGERLSHVVFMGMGEPLANYRATVEAVRRLNAPWGLAIAQRRITVSTVGLPRQIERLAPEGLQVNLALSLHSPDDRLRRDLVPWAKSIPLARLLEACRSYFCETGREVTLEYCLLAGVNDRRADAEGLADIARDLRANVNLLMYNPVASLPYERPSRRRAIAFLGWVRERGLNARLRESRGLEADAACGQLRRREVAE
jgi:23S rRNA (adenine2503-C2)-methyltransferase